MRDRDIYETLAATGKGRKQDILSVNAYCEIPAFATLPSLSCRFREIISANWLRTLQFAHLSRRGAEESRFFHCRKRKGLKGVFLRLKSARLADKQSAKPDLPLRSERSA